jgi:uncharacterized damage-inducible protein DinB
MLTPEALLEIHDRAHRNLKSYLAHCRPLDPEALDRTMPEFSGASIRLQLHHAIGAERYWIGVLQGRVDADDDAHLYPTIESLEGYRETTFDATQAYLRSASREELNTPRPMRTWKNEEHVLHPGHVVMRTITHIYHHQGQIASMLRILGNPSPGFNYPIGEVVVD